MLEPPYRHWTPTDITSALKDGLRPIIASHCEPVWATLMIDCWRDAPDMRPSAHDLVVPGKVIPV